MPTCSCGNEVDPRRVEALDGEVRCMECPPPPPRVLMAEVSKSNLTITQDPRAASPVAQAGWTGRSDPKGNGNYMRLEKKQ